ncbi:copper homeostasis membrane protein CopD [Bradyrhizobium sp.]|uniref:copper homeostasis membrane protein CopD n=1 Tax=Bradyrhizobium sp. TaxID=376 RepID=UPI002620AAEC|nr:copper homeostasis membrane protein CopD [Bradyrhizobium sp.]
MIDPLIVARDLHLASTIIVAGVIFFDLFIAVALWRTKPPLLAARAVFQSSSRNVLWVCLALSIASALAWLWLLSMRIGHQDFRDVISDGTVWRVLSQTQFGFAWQMRLLLGAGLAVCLLLKGTSGGRLAGGLVFLAGLLAAAYLGSLAFAGHGAEGLGIEQHIHLAADFLHLIAAGLWLGALVPLVLLLVHLGRFQEDGWASAAARAGSRFSTLGIFAVGILLVSGLVNAAFLLGGMHSLIDTAYGRLLLLKVVLFAAMVCLAGINRQYLVPRLYGSRGTGGASATARRFVQSALVEIAMGLAIVCIVGALGIMAPANDMAAYLH